MTSILLVEDDASCGSVSKDFLKLHQYEVVWADDGSKGLKEAKTQSFDICILDVMMPQIDGFTLASEIARLHPGTPFIFLTAKGLKEDMVEGFKLGAADYITKPFDSELLLYRIQAALRKNPVPASNDTEVIRIGAFLFDKSTRNVEGPGGSEKLSPKEAELLEMLYVHKNQVLPREIALKSIWKDDTYFTARSMDVYITKLRKYLKGDPSIRIENMNSCHTCENVAMFFLTDRSSST